MSLPPVYLSPSKSSCLDDCPRKYFFQYEAKVKERMGSPNLAFGKAYDDVWTRYLLETVHEGRLFDLEAFFVQQWKLGITGSMKWGKTADAKTLEDIGRKLVQQIPEAWEKTGYSLLLDRMGAPVVQKDIVLNVGNGVTMRMKLDLAVITDDGRLYIIDIKTTARENEEFAEFGEQVLDYQIGVDDLAASEGWGQVDGIGFWESIKQKTNPRINAPEIRHRASEALVQERLRKLQWQAKLIRMGEFYKAPRAAFNTPCGMCSYTALCHRFDAEDVIVPNPDILKRIGITLAA